MKKIIVSTLTIVVMSFFNLGNNSIAEEVVLCVSEADQYIVMVNEKGDCLEDEDQMVLSGSGMEAKKSMSPLATFKANEDCEGEGMITAIGFDENGNGGLDTNEIDSTSGTCNPVVAENEE